MDVALNEHLFRYYCKKLVCAVLSLLLNWGCGSRLRFQHLRPAVCRAPIRTVRAQSNSEPILVPKPQLVKPVALPTPSAPAASSPPALDLDEDKPRPDRSARERPRITRRERPGRSSDDAQGRPQEGTSVVCYLILVDYVLEASGWYDFE